MSFPVKGGEDMSKAKTWVVLLTLSLASLQLQSVFAFDNQVSRETLRGLQGVRVMAAPLKWVVEQKGLTTDQLQQDTELKLRLAGIKVPSEESPELPGRPLLYLNATILRYGSLERYIFNIKLELNQEVALVRKPSAKASATTWSVALTGTSHKLSTVRDQVKELVDTFVNAYLSVNSK